MKRFVLISTLLSSLFAENNLIKEELFKNRYLQDKASMKNEISVDELYKNTKDLNLSSIRTDLNLSKEDFEKEFGKLNSNQNKEANLSAQDISNLRRSEAFNKEVVKNEDYILNDKGFKFNEFLGEYSKNTQAMIEQMQNSKHLISTNKYLNPNEKIFIIISSSMSKSSIQNYFKILEKVNTDVSFILRGIVGNDVRYFNPTRAFIQELLIKNENANKEDKNNYFSFNIEINPKITRRFNITQVPAVLFIKNYNPVVQDYQDVIGKPENNEDYFVAYGEVGVDYALEQINKEAKSEGLGRLLKTMKSSFYNN